ncbi:hypothetical protein [Nocardioides sp. NPDC047086]|uniref:hypothetical protein n=1 Tax=Nocardioides sp. NPDC047086 TaxID=3154810 RepID=UPI0033F65C08
MTDRPLLRALGLASCLIGMTALTACAPIYGADFDYPDEPPVPPNATVIADAKGWDDDDPMRGLEVVIDIGSSEQAELVEFYRERFPSTEGWMEGTAAPEDADWHVLCLVSHEDERFDEYVEVFPYDHDSYDRDLKSAGPGRYLVSISRLHAIPEQGERTTDQCGQASVWFPTDP